MFDVPHMYRLRHGPMASDETNGNNGAFLIPCGGTTLRVIASDGGGWEHVSVSLPDRCPTWEEMCRVKGMFWGDEDCVIQYHPAKSQYVNCHPYCLHLWRPTFGQIPTPPIFMIGPKG